MRITGKDVFYFVLAGSVGYILYRTFALGEDLSTAVSTGFDKFREGLFFSKESLGPVVTLTPGAQLSQADYIARGYLEVLPDGRTRITPAGEAYIRSQQAKVVQGEIVN